MIKLKLPFRALLGLGIAFFSSSVFANDLIMKDTLSIGSDLTYPPYAYMEDNKPAGFDVEFTELLAKEMNLKPNYVDTRFPSLITGIRSFKFDIIASAMFISEERSKVLDFIPYIKTGNSMMVLKSSTYQPKEVEELCGKTIGSIRGGAWIPALGKLSSDYCVKNAKPTITINEYDTDPQVTQALRSGAIDVQMSDASVIANVTGRFPGQFIVTSDKLIFPVLIGLGFNKNNKELALDVDKAFTQLRENGSYKTLIDKYNFHAPDADDFTKATNALK